MLTSNQLDHVSEQESYFINLKVMKDLIRTMPSKRNHKYDGRFKNRGLSKLMTDVYAISELNKKVVKQKAKSSDDVQRMEKIIETVSLETGIPIHKFKGKRRTRPEADARHIISFIARLTTSLHLGEIGKYSSDGFAKDHSTIIHACQKVVDKLGTNDSFTHTFDAVRNKLKLLHGIEFNLEDWTKFPDWYRKMREK